jgi:DnaD/phage-associated family protein
MLTNMDEESLQDRRDLPVFIHSELDDLPLSPNAFRLYCHLARRAGTGTAWPSYQSMGDKCYATLAEGKSRRNIAIKAMKELVDLGLIKKEMRQDEIKGNKSNIYYLTPRREWADPNIVAIPGLTSGECQPSIPTIPKGTPSEVTPITPVVVVVEEHATTAEIFQMWSNQTKGMFTSVSSDILGGMIDSYGAEAVKQAIIDAEKQGKRSLGYVQGILRNRLAGTEPQKPAQQPARTSTYNKPMSKVDASMAAVDNVFAMMKEQGITWE